MCRPDPEKRLYCGMDVAENRLSGGPAALRMLGIALVTACLLTFGTIGARFLNPHPNPFPAGERGPQRIGKRPYSPWASTPRLAAGSTLGVHFRPTSFTTMSGSSDLKAVLPVSGTSDLKAVLPVPPSATRVYGVRQSDNPAAVIMMYASSGLSPEQIAEFYLQEMPIYGWREGEAEERELNKYAEGIMLFFRRTGRECVIYVESEGPGATWTVVARPMIIGGKQ